MLRYYWLCLCVCVALAVFGRSVEGQVSTSFGGDLSGRPSAAVVSKIRSVPTGTTVPVSGNYLRFDGAAWDADPGPDPSGGGGGGGGSSPVYYLPLSTLTTTSTHTVGTGNTTIATIAVAGSNWAAWNRVEWNLATTHNATTSWTHTVAAYILETGTRLPATAASVQAGSMTWQHAGLQLAYYPAHPAWCIGFGGWTPNIFGGVNGLYLAQGGPFYPMGANYTIRVPAPGSSLTIDLTSTSNNNNPSNSVTVLALQVWLRRAAP